MSSGASLPSFISTSLENKRIVLIFMGFVLFMLGVKTSKLLLKIFLQTSLFFCLSLNIYIPFKAYVCVCTDIYSTQRPSEKYSAM